MHSCHRVYPVIHSLHTSDALRPELRGRATLVVTYIEKIYSDEKIKDNM